MEHTNDINEILEDVVSKLENDFPKIIHMLEDGFFNNALICNLYRGYDVYTIILYNNNSNIFSRSSTAPCIILKTPGGITSTQYIQSNYKDYILFDGHVDKEFCNRMYKLYRNEYKVQERENEIKEDLKRKRSLNSLRDL